MAEVVKRARQVNRDLLPEEIADYEILELTDTEVAYGRTAEDKRGRVNKTGRALVHLAITSGAYEEIPIEAGTGEETPLEARVKELEKQLRDERRSHRQEIDSLKSQLAEKDTRITELQERVAERDNQIAELRQQILEIQQATTGVVDQLRQRGTIDDQAAEEIGQHLDRAAGQTGTQRPAPATQQRPAPEQQPAPQQQSAPAERQPQPAVPTQPEQTPQTGENGGNGDFEVISDKIKANDGKEYIIIKKGDKIFAVEATGGQPDNNGEDQPKPEDDPDIEKVGEFEREMMVGKKEGEKFRLGYKIAAFKEKDGKKKIRIEKDGKSEWVEEGEIKKESEITDEETLVEGPAAPPPPEQRRRVEQRLGFMERIRARVTGREPREYYVDDNGRYYYIEDEERVYVPDEEVEGRARGVGAVAVAAGLAFIGWELLERYVLHWEGGGSGDLKKVIHNQAVEINNLHKINNHLTEVDKHIHRELWHDHKHELRKITATEKMVHRLLGEEAREHRGPGIKEHLQDNGLYYGFRYPWDWAVSKVGSLRAEGYLHSLAAKAAEHGHKVRWIFAGHEPNGAVKEILQVDGTTNTQKVVSIVNQYR